VDFSVAHGERVALIGSSGSGKHSLFKVLLDLYQPVNFNPKEKSLRFSVAKHTPNSKYKNSRFSGLTG
jgi:ABC-type oligopeptide transport system ATPase subunit